MSLEGRARLFSLHSQLRVLIRNARRLSIMPRVRAVELAASGGVRCIGVRLRSIFVLWGFRMYMGGLIGCNGPNSKGTRRCIRK